MSKKAFRIGIPILILLFTFNGQIRAQVELDDEGFETFIYQDEDSTYTMKKYYICFLKSGPNKSENPEEAATLQAQHLAHMADLAENGKICIVGPMADDTSLRGIVIYNAKNMEEARSYADSDPMVKAGLLEAEIHPWWTAKGSKLY